MFAEPYSRPSPPQTFQDSETLRIEARNLWSEIARFLSLYDVVTAEVQRGNGALSSAGEDSADIVALANALAGVVAKLDPERVAVGLADRYAVTDKMAVSRSGSTKEPG